MPRKTKIVQDKKTGKIKGSKKGITPDELMDHFEAYRKWCKKNPKYKEVPNTKENSVIRLEMEVPLTKTSFSLYLRRNKITGNGNEILWNRDGRYPEFKEVNQYIEDSTTDDQFLGGMANIFNANLAARALGISDKQEVKTEGKIKISFRED